jgi:hypothetical protein
VGSVEGLYRLSKEWKLLSLKDLLQAIKEITCHVSSEGVNVI